MQGHSRGIGSRRRRLGRGALAGALAGFVGLVAGPASAEDGLNRYDNVRFDARAASTSSLPAPATGARQAFASGPSLASGSRAFTARPAAPVSTGLRTVCVRLCDGYHFPVGPLRSRADLPVHQEACNAACPGAPVKLFMTPRNAGVERAVAEDRTLYRRLTTAFAYRRGVSEACSCTGPGNVASRLPILRDRTLRPGDAYVTGVEAKVFAGDRSLVRTEAAFQELGRAKAMPRSARRQLHAMLEGNRRARTEIATAPVTAVASAFAPARRAERPGSFQVAQAPGRGFAAVDASPDARAVRVVVVSPYRVAR